MNKKGKKFGENESCTGNESQMQEFFGKYRSFLIIPLVILLILFGFNSFYIVSEQEQAVVTTFGAVTSVQTSGPHFKIPFIQKITKVNTTTQGFAIGYVTEDEIEEHKKGFSALFTSEENDTQLQEYINDEDALMITSDFNFVNIDFYIEYKISDARKYLYNSEKPKLILKNISQGCIRTVVSSYTVDEVITTGKNEIQANIKEMIIKELEEKDIGIQLVNINIQDSEPPTEDVMTAFKDVETAKQSKETNLNNANKYANEKIPQAEANADKIIQEAETEKQSRINDANAQVVRFNEMYAEYIKNPLITKQRIFYETMEEILPNVDLIIDAGNGDIQKLLPLDPLSTTYNTTNSTAAEEVTKNKTDKKEDKTEGKTEDTTEREEE